MLLDTVDSTLLTIALYIGDSRKPVPKSDIFGYLCMSKEGDAGYCCSPQYVSSRQGEQIDSDRDRLSRVDGHRRRGDRPHRHPGLQGTSQLLAAALHHDADRFSRWPENSLLTEEGIPQ